MSQRLISQRLQKLKLLALMGLFAAPLLIAWIMMEWRVGIPEAKVAHGELMPALPSLAHWPLAEPVRHDVLASEDWLLVYTCEAGCAERADRLWRVHRALGREAPRVTRLRLGGAAPALPGERVAQWQERPAWSQAASVWLLDAEGRAVLSYRRVDDPARLLEDLRRLLRMNPQHERVSMQ